MRRAVRVLFVPAFAGIPSHFITLVKLYQRMRDCVSDAAFFLPRFAPRQPGQPAAEQPMIHADYYYCGEFYANFDIPVLPLSRKYTVSSELAAYARFKPDLVIDDCSLTTAVALGLRTARRITLLRSGTFAGETPCAPGLGHSLDPMLAAVRVPASYGMRARTRIEDYFDADAYLVPGLMSVESNCDVARTHGRVAFCGPLLLDSQEESMFHAAGLDSFLDANRGKRLAYVTFGAVAAKDAHVRIARAFESLFAHGFAVVSNIPPCWPNGAGRHYHYAPVLPMHQLCKRADLVVHVAGSATAYYPLVHGKPAITIATRCVDRELVAVRLQELGLSRHVAATDDTRFEEQFTAAVAAYAAAEYPFDEGLASRLQAVQGELHRTVMQFDPRQLIDTALAHDSRRAQ